MTSLPANLAFKSQTAGSWLVRPFQIVSLLDVLSFSAFDYVQMIRDLEHLTTLEGRTDLVLPMLHGTGKDKLINPLSRFAHSCGKMKLKLTAQHAREIIQKVNNASPFILPDSGVTGMKLAPKESQLDPDAFVSEIRQLRDNFRRELEQRQFMIMLPNERKHFNKRNRCGARVRERFPSANEEVTFAGNCYATGNFTACAFHLMRAIEHGARAMIADLRLTNQLPFPIELCSWEDLIRVLDPAVTGLKTRRKRAKAQRSEFYNQALGLFRNLRAWRDPVMHTRKRYQRGETEDLIENSRQFLQLLSQRLKERKRKSKV